MPIMGITALKYTQPKQLLFKVGSWWNECQWFLGTLSLFNLCCVLSGLLVPSQILIPTPYPIDSHFLGSPVYSSVEIFSVGAQWPSPKAVLL